MASFRSSELQTSSCEILQPDLPTHRIPASPAPHTSKSCPICLESISDEAFLDPCFHSFCFPCILQWSEIVGASRQPRSGDRFLECPLCKARCTSIIHNIVLETFQRYPLFGSQAAKKPFFLTDAHYRRLALYKKNLCCGISSGEITCKRRGIRIAGNKSLKCWVLRELQALMQEEDVDIVAQHVIGVLEYFEKRQNGQFGIAVTWNDAVLDAVRPFLYENAKKFCEELQAFLMSGLSVSAYDQLVEATLIIS